MAIQGWPLIQAWRNYSEGPHDAPAKFLFRLKCSAGPEDTSIFIAGLRAPVFLLGRWAKALRLSR
jgi:hypothetical protein